MKGLAVTLAVIVGALAGFWGGFHTGKTAPPTTTAAAAAVPTVAPSSTAGGTRGGGGSSGPGGTGGGGIAGGGGRGGTIGTVTAVTSTGFTVHNPNSGTDTKVTFGSPVVVRKTVTGQTSDLQDGLTVQVTGQAAADGSVTATGITITPAATPGG